MSKIYKMEVHQMELNGTRHGIFFLCQIKINNAIPRIIMGHINIGTIKISTIPTELSSRQKEIEECILNYVTKLPCV